MATNKFIKLDSGLRLLTLEKRIPGGGAYLTAVDLTTDLRISFVLSDGNSLTTSSPLDFSSLIPAVPTLSDLNGLTEEEIDAKIPDVPAQKTLSQLGGLNQTQATALINSLLPVLPTLAQLGGLTQT